MLYNASSSTAERQPKQKPSGKSVHFARLQFASFGRLFPLTTRIYMEPRTHSHDIEQFLAFLSMALAFSLIFWSGSPSLLNLAVSHEELRWPLVVALIGAAAMGTSCAKLRFDGLCKLSLVMLFLVWSWVGAFAFEHIGPTAPTALISLVACGFALRGYLRLEWTWQK